MGFALSTVDKYAGKKVASQVGALASSKPRVFLCLHVLMLCSGRWRQVIREIHQVIGMLCNLGLVDNVLLIYSCNILSSLGHCRVIGVHVTGRYATSFRPPFVNSHNRPGPVLYSVLSRAMSPPYLDVFRANGLGSANASQISLNTVHDRAPLISPATPSYGATFPASPTRSKTNSRRLIVNAVLKMATIFLISSLLLGGILWIALPVLEESVLWSTF